MRSDERFYFLLASFVMTASLVYTVFFHVLPELDARKNYLYAHCTVTGDGHWEKYETVYGIKERVVVPVEVRIGTIEGALDWDGVDPVGGRICCVSYAALALLVFVRCFLCISQPVRSELLLPSIPTFCCALIVPHTSPAPMHPMPCAPYAQCDADDIANPHNFQLNSTDVYHQGIGRDKPSGWEYFTRDEKQNYLKTYKPGREYECWMRPGSGTNEVVFHKKAVTFRLVPEIVFCMIVLFLCVATGVCMVCSWSVCDR